MVNISQTNYRKDDWLSKINQYPLAVISIVYFGSWLVVYNGMSFPPRLLIIGIMGALLFVSYRYAVAIIVLVSFIMFYQDYFRDVGLSGVTPLRILVVPFIYLSLTREKSRSFPANKWLVLLVLLSIFTIKFTSGLVKVIQEIPPQYRFDSNKVSMFYFIASYYDVIAKLCIAYFAFTRLSLKDLNWLMDVILLIVLLEALSIVHMVIDNPEALLNFRGKDANRVLWNNPFFGNKNDWGMMFSFAVAVILIRWINNKDHQIYFLFAFFWISLGVGFSLSRQAYVYTILVFLVITIASGNRKLLWIWAASLLLIIVIQPEFLTERLSIFSESSSVEDIQSENRKFGELAIQQAKDNFQLVPRMFTVTMWEYNWSEGFWNGMLHQQGIIGLLFHLFLYGFLFVRYLNYFLISDQRLKLYSLLGMIFTFLMFVAHFNRQTFHFIHYEGPLRTESWFIILIFTYVELIIYAFKNRLSDYKLL